MAMTPSTMPPLGMQAPGFTLPNSVDGRSVALEDFSDRKGLLVVFTCNHCPFVIHLQEAFVAFAKEVQEQGIGVVAISSNNIDTHPDDAPDKMKAKARELGFTFPYLYDESQDVAQTYRAACTPDFFLFDADRRLYYRGQFDDTRPNSGKQPTGDDLRNAVDSLLAGGPAPQPQIPSAGCNIKWKPGNEPAV